MVGNSGELILMLQVHEPDRDNYNTESDDTFSRGRWALMILPKRDGSGENTNAKFPGLYFATANFYPHISVGVSLSLIHI